MASVDVTASATRPSERDEPDREIEPQHDFGRDLPEVEHLVGDEEQDVGRGVDEGADPEHAPHVDQAVEAADPGQRRHRQGHQQEHQRPVAGAVDQVVDRARAEPGGEEGMGRKRDRQRQEGQHRDPQCRYAAATVTPECEATES